MFNCILSHCEKPDGKLEFRLEWEGPWTPTWEPQKRASRRGLYAATSPHIDALCHVVYTLRHHGIAQTEKYNSKKNWAPHLGGRHGRKITHTGTTDTIQNHTHRHHGLTTHSHTCLDNSKKRKRKRRESTQWWRAGHLLRHKTQPQPLGKTTADVLT